jgi:hypothetical protein
LIMFINIICFGITKIFSTHRTSKFGFYNPSSDLLPAGEGIAAEF